MYSCLLSRLFLPPAMVHMLYWLVFTALPVQEQPYKLPYSMRHLISLESLISHGRARFYGVHTVSAWWPEATFDQHVPQELSSDAAGCSDRQPISVDSDAKTRRHVTFCLGPALYATYRTYLLHLVQDLTWTSRNVAINLICYISCWFIWLGIFHGS